MRFKPHSLEGKPHSQRASSHTALEVQATQPRYNQATQQATQFRATFGSGIKHLSVAVWLGHRGHGLYTLMQPTEHYMYLEGGR